MKQVKKISFIPIVTLILCFMFVFSFLLPLNRNTGYALATGETTYSNVLEDLQKDESFDASKYPVNNEDYSLQVIQVAESNAKELFIYVYQPCTTRDLTATTITISTVSKGVPQWRFFHLLHLNSNGVLHKYLVKNFEVCEDEVRCYDITEIHRKWIKGVDDEPGNDNTIGEVAFSVAKQWQVATNGDNVIYSCFDTDTINITDKFVGYCRYGDGYGGIPGAGLGFYKPGYDSHFVAFSTDREIESLKEAEVYYDTQMYSYFKQKDFIFITTKEIETFGQVKEDNYKKLTYDDKVTVVDSSGNVSNHHVFERIQSVDKFIETENFSYVYNVGGFFEVEHEVVLTEEAKNTLKNKQWVLRFAETQYTDTQFSKNGSTSISKTKTIVGNVSILRLKFETAGKTYNLGVVDNKQTGSFDPSNKITDTFKLAKWFREVLKWIGIVILIVAGIALLGFFMSFLPIVAPIGNAILKGLKAIFKGLWWTITIPYQILTMEET